MRILLIGAAMALGTSCVAAQPPANDEAPAPQTAGVPAPATAGSPAPAAPVAATPTAPPPADARPSGRPPSGTKLYPGDIGFDCGRMLSRTEIETVCGEQLNTVLIDGIEGRKEVTACSRRWRHEDKRTVSMIVSAYENEEKVQSLSAPAGATELPPMAGTGFRAQSYREDKGGVIQWDTFRVLAGTRVIYLRSITPSGGTPLCDATQLATLAVEVVGRTEQILP